MNTHPVYTQRRVAEKRHNGMETKITPNGHVVSWKLMASTKLEMPIVLSALTADERDAVLAFEEANCLAPFLFHWWRDAPDVFRTVVYVTKTPGESPVQVAPVTPTRYDVTFTVREV